MYSGHFLLLLLDIPAVLLLLLGRNLYLGFFLFRFIPWGLFHSWAFSWAFARVFLRRNQAQGVQVIDDVLHICVFCFHVSVWLFYIEVDAFDRQVLEFKLATQ